MRLRQAGIASLALLLAACASFQSSSASPSASSSDRAQPSSLANSTLAPEPSPARSSASAPELPRAPSSLLGTVLIPFADREMKLALVGPPGIVARWRAATEEELAALTSWGNVEIALGRLTDHDLVLGWIGTICDVEASLSIAPHGLVISPAPRDGCDAMAIGRGVVLSFANPVDPAAITVELRPTVVLPAGS